MLAPPQTLVEDFDDELGPAMQALPSQAMRAFVKALYCVEPGKGASVRAAQLAGYGTGASTRRSLSAIAGRLMSDSRVQSALAEEGQRQFRGLAPIAHGALKNLLSNPNHKHHARTVLAYIAAAQPVEQRHLHQHQHGHFTGGNWETRNDADLKLYQMLKEKGANAEFLTNIFGYSGLSRIAKLVGDETNVIEHSSAHETKSGDT